MLEYRERDCLELNSSELRYLRLSLDEIGWVEFKPGWLGGGNLNVTGYRLSTFGDFPQFRTGAMREQSRLRVEPAQGKVAPEYGVAR